MIGILESESLITSRTKEHGAELSQSIRELDEFVKFRLLPLDHEILDRFAKGTFNEAFVIEVGETKMEYESKVQTAYSLVAKIKTSLV